MLRINQCLLAVLLLAFTVPAPGQGLYWETTMTMKMTGDQIIDMKSYYLPGMFKHGSPEEAVIYRMDKKTMAVVNYPDREYSEITFAQLDTIVRNANKEFVRQMDELKKQLAAMPEDQRKAMEQMMGANLNAAAQGMKAEVTKGGGKRTINGHACTDYVLKIGGQENATIWTTADIPGFAAMQKDFKSFSQRTASQMTMNGWQLAEAMLEVDGFPMETTVSGMTATVTKVARQDVSRTEFEVPAGFKKVPFEEMDGGHNGMDDEDMEEGEDEDADDDGGDDDGGMF